MNEITKIHLGRQAFTISVDAHHELRSYLDAIEKQVGEKDVVDEIELRMAELLAEHGINASKVILSSDIEFLKSQLGNPTDFTEDTSEASYTVPKQSETKRLFRDTNNAVVAGVASGLAQYFGIDVMIIRVLFVVATLFTFGWGILLYIVFWLLVPEAKTSSDRLQMAGKPINVDSLKEIVERADVKGAAHRVNAVVAGPINNIFSFILKFIGICFIVTGLSVLFGLIAAETYILIHSGSWAQNNIFPIGLSEHLLLDIAISVVGLVTLFIILFGIAMFRRKWPIRAWVTGMLVGLIFIGGTVGGVLVADVYPNVRDRYDSNIHITTRSLTPFSTLNITGPEENINFQTSNTYSVSLKYYDDPNLTNVKTIVRNKTLVIDSTQFDRQRNCPIICFPKTYNLSITVYSPNAQQLAPNQESFVPFVPPKPIYQP